MKQLFIAVIASGLFLSFTKEKQFTPPGTVQVSETLFADETEISNFAWQEYEYWTKTIYGTNSPEHLATLPDTLVWRDKLAYNEPYVQYYYRHPAYKNYPVVGISYEQAQAYCKWRTERVKTFLSINKNFKHQNFEYRLPTKAEWEKFAELSSVVFSNNGKDAKGNFKFNFIDIPNTPKNNTATSDNADVTAPVFAYKKNHLGLYNVLGNVAEMVQEKNICKGGSWQHKLEDCRVGKDQQYTTTNSWTGFRCVCEVKKNEI